VPSPGMNAPVLHGRWQAVFHNRSNGRSTDLGNKDYTESGEGWQEVWVYCVR
jgi:hypothetical protein